MNKLTIIQRTWQFRRQQKLHRLAQGRLTTQEAAVQLAGEGHIPLAAITNGHSQPVTLNIPLDTDGHLLLVAPPDSGWQAQIARTLAQWPGAAIVVDPGRRLYQQTGYWRQRAWGPVYPIPGYRVNLAHYFPIWQEAAAWQLHHYLMPPTPPAERWQLDRAADLFTAIGLYSHEHKLNPLRVLLNAAISPMLQVLVALETADLAQHHVRLFTKGQSPWQALDDPEVVQCFTLFGRQLHRYQGLYHAFTTLKGRDILPEKWAQAKGTVYLTYPETTWPEMAGLTAALVDGLFSAHCRYGNYEPMLLVLDAALAQRLSNFPAWLTMAAAYGVTIILKAASLAELHLLAPDEDGAGLAGQFAHQVWYPSHDQQTAEHMTWLYGSQLRQTDEGHPLPPEPVLTPPELLAWPRERVMVYTRQERPYRFLAESVTVPADWPQRPPPLSPQSAAEPRDFASWLPIGIDAFMDPDFLAEMANRRRPVIPDKTVVVSDKDDSPEASVNPPSANETKSNPIPPTNPTQLR